MHTQWRVVLRLRTVPAAPTRGTASPATLRLEILSVWTLSLLMVRPGTVSPGGAQSAPGRYAKKSWYIARQCLPCRACRGLNFPHRRVFLPGCWRDCMSVIKALQPFLRAPCSAHAEAGVHSSARGCDGACRRSLASKRLRCARSGEEPSLLRLALRSPKTEDETFLIGNPPHGRHLSDACGGILLCVPPFSSGAAR